MARAFRATTRGFSADLQTHERRLLSQLCADVIQLLSQRGRQVDPDGQPEHDGAAEPDEFSHFRQELAGLGAQEDAPEGLQAPEDEVLERLLPAGSRDPEEAAVLRRLSESSLRSSHIADLRTARMLLESDQLWLTDAQAPIFGRALNAVRLTLAVRLGIDDEDSAQQVQQQALSGRSSTTEEFMAELYTFATWLQESLFTAMLETLPDEGTAMEGTDFPEDSNGDDS